MGVPQKGSMIVCDHAGGGSKAVLLQGLQKGTTPRGIRFAIPLPS